MKKNAPRQTGRTAELPLLQQLTIEQSTAEPKALLVLKLLRETASKYQSGHSHPFYSVRDVAARFRLSPATVCRVYQHLCSERLLRLIWGSQTLVEPLQSARRRKPQSVAVPVDVARFTSSPEYREAILTIQRELWAHNVAEQLIFFEHSAEEVLHLCKRYHLHSVDTVIWAFPEKVARRILSKLGALGMRVICIATNRPPGACECYILSPGCSVSRVVRDKILNAT